MKKIPFDIKYRPEIEAGKYKVVTRDEQPVRIICWDRNDIEYPIVALVKSKCGEETPFTYGKRGNFFANECDNDLFLAPTEPELTEFEEAVGSEIFDPPFNVEQVKVIKEESAKLLSLARNEIVKSGYAIIEGEHYLEEGRKNYERGKAEALKELPRWKKCAPCDEDKATPPAWIVRFDAESAGESAVVHNGHYILFGDLEKLPKEE